MMFFTHDFPVDLSRIMKSRYEVTHSGLGATGPFCVHRAKRAILFSDSTYLKISAENAHVFTLKHLLTNVSRAITRPYGRVLMREQMIVI